MQGLRLDEKGRLESVTWADEEWSLDVRERAVGGPVEPLALTSSVTMWVHAEGASLCPINNPASRLMRLHDRNGIITPVFGPAVITGSRGDEVTGLLPCEIAWLHAWLSGRCTCIEQREGRAAACGAESGHPGVSHETVVGATRWIWYGAPARSLGAVACVTSPEGSK